MAITKEKKKDILKRLEGIKNESASIVFVSAKGLPVLESTQMRASLREKEIGYFVPKKTLMRRAFEGAFEGESPEIPSEVALAYGTDALAPAQSVREFEKQYKDNLSILGGVFQGVYKNKEEMTEIASIPPLPVLRGMFVNVINSPIQGLALALNAIAEKKS